ncbi:MAG: sulfatase [Deltaproteobacteria bacterium]|nr:sulfatase [Deltaproteobacteria bacterium]
MSDPIHDAHRDVTRRHFLRQCPLGLGALSLASLLDESVLGGATSGPDRNPFAPRPPHFPARAKNVIYLHMAGSPTQLDLFDDKPKLRQLSGQRCPDSLLEGKKFAFIRGVPKMLGSPYGFRRHGESGQVISELLPNLASVSDDIAVIRSMHTDQFNHAPAQMLLFTGSPRFGRPSMGSWVTYGLGTENQDLPGFVVLVSSDKAPSSGKSVWGSGFLPSVYQGVQCRSQGDPVLYLSDPSGMDRKVRRRSLDALRDLNSMQLPLGDPETETRIAQYELAFRMQMSVPEAMDISRESPAMHELYGSDPGKSSFANNCLLARRLVERGVRFVQLFDWGWDHHGSSKNEDINHPLPAKCRQVDRPMAALVKDLKARGLLDETLIVWGGEFGRTPMQENRNKAGFVGRDHHPYCFTMWMAGGGVRSGYSHGKTDDIGYYVAEDPVPVHDLQATILHLLGFDHERLTYRFQGREFRLTDVFGSVVPGLIV